MQNIEQQEALLKLTHDNIITNKPLIEWTEPERRVFSLALLPPPHRKERADRWSIEERKAMNLARWLVPGLRYWLAEQELAIFGIAAVKNSTIEERQIAERLRADLLKLLLRNLPTHGWLKREVICSQH